MLKLFACVHSEEAIIMGQFGFDIQEVEFVLAESRDEAISISGLAYAVELNYKGIVKITCGADHL